MKLSTKSIHFKMLITSPCHDLMILIRRRDLNGGRWFARRWSVGKNVEDPWPIANLSWFDSSSGVHWLVHYFLHILMGRHHC